MKKIPKKLLISAVICCLIIAVSGIGAFAYTNGIQSTAPEDPSRILHNNPPPVVPTLLPPGEPSWQQCHPSDMKSAAPIAYLNDGYEKGALSTAVSYFKSDFSSEQVVAYRILSAVKYEFNTGTTMVTLSEASPAAVKANAVYGFATVKLDNGEKAFLKDGLSGTYPRSLVVIHNNQIITIATTENQESLIKMAANLIITE